MSRTTADAGKWVSIKRFALGSAVAVAGAALGMHAMALAGPLTGTASPVQVSGTSPFDATCGLSGQTGTNFPNSEVEPQVDVNPIDSNNLVGSWQQDRWSNGGARGIGAAASFDGGTTWETTVLPGLTECSGGDFERASDPWLSISPDGTTVYHASLAINSTDNRSAILVNESDDGGLTWSEPTTIIDTDVHGGAFNDKESITADPNDSSFVYVVWQRAGDPWSARTTNADDPGPATWDGPEAILTTRGFGSFSVGHQIVVLPENEESHPGGLVNVFFFRDKGKAQVALLRSSDKGETWTSSPTTVAVMDPTGVTDPDAPRKEPAFVRTSGVLPDVAVDPNSGNLYAVWQDDRFDTSDSPGKGKGSGKENPAAIAFTMSENGGDTWTTPIKINQTPTNIATGNQQAFTPTVEVAGDGTVGVSYYDFRNNTDDPDDPDPLLTDYWVVHCHPSSGSCADSTTWEEETRITDEPFDMRQAPVARGFFVGDYEGLAGLATTFVPFFSQTHEGDPGSIFAGGAGAEPTSDPTATPSPTDSPLPLPTPLPTLP